MDMTQLAGLTAQKLNERFGYKAVDLFNKSRKARYVRMRKLFCKLAAEHGYTREEIGDYVGINISSVTNHVNGKEI